MDTNLNRSVPGIVVLHEAFQLKFVFIMTYYKDRIWVNHPCVTIRCGEFYLASICVRVLTNLAFNLGGSSRIPYTFGIFNCLSD